MRAPIFTATNFESMRKTAEAMQSKPPEALEDVVRELLSNHRDRLENISGPMFARLNMALDAQVEG